MYRRRAQTLPEFAIVVPLFLLLLFGMIDFSRMLFTYVSITNGARELARVISVTSPWVQAANHALDTTNTVKAFNQLTVLAGPAVGVQNFSISPALPGTGTVTCASIASSGCGVLLGIDYASLKIAFSPISGQGASGAATYKMASTSIPNLASFGITADGDYASVFMIEEGNSTGQTAAGFLQICPLPMTTSCVLSNLVMWDGAGGTIEVDTSYTFHYSPLFENKLGSVVNVSFLRPLSVLTTTTRTTGE